MFCPSCGKENANGAKFCFSCGVKTGVALTKEAVPSDIIKSSDVVEEQSGAATTDKLWFYEQGGQRKGGITEVEKKDFLIG